MNFSGFRTAVDKKSSLTTKWILKQIILYHQCFNLEKILQIYSYENSTAPVLKLILPDLS